jgi:hypothetical protein
MGDEIVTPTPPKEDKPCINLDSSGIEVVVGLVCITVIAVAAIFIMKDKANEIAIAGVSGMVGWLSKTGYNYLKEKLGQA